MSFLSIVVFIVGFILGCYYIIYIQKMSLLKYKKDVEKIFNNVINNFSKVCFTKRVNKYAYFHYENCDIIYQLDNDSIHIFDKDVCLATSNQIKTSLVPKNLIEKIKSKWDSDINDITTIGENIFSNNFIRENIVKETKKWTDPILNKIEENQSKIFNIDSLLDKINEVGYINLTEEEKNFLNNSSK